MRQSGFTLVEILLVVAMIAILSAGGVVLQQSLAGGRTAQSAAQSVVAAIRQGQARSVAMAADTMWGVHIASESVVVFSGDDYGARDESLDRVTGFSGAVVVTGTTDIIFPKGALAPLTVASTSLTALEQVWTVRVTDEGVIIYEAH